MPKDGAVKGIRLVDYAGSTVPWGETEEEIVLIKRAGGKIRLF